MRRRFPNRRKCAAFSGSRLAKYATGCLHKGHIASAGYRFSLGKAGSLKVWLKGYFKLYPEVAYSALKLPIDYAYDLNGFTLDLQVKPVLDSNFAFSLTPTFSVSYSL